MWPLYFFKYLLFLYMPTLCDNFLMCDKYSCPGNNIRNAKNTISVTKDLYLKIVSYVHITLYNAVYLYKLHFKIDCGNIILRWPKIVTLTKHKSMPLCFDYYFFTLTMVTGHSSVSMSVTPPRNDTYMHLLSLL